MARKKKATGLDVIGHIPSTWSVLRLKDVLRQPTSLRKVVATQYVGLEQIAGWSGVAVPIAIGVAGLESAQLIREGSICFSKLRPYLAKALVADTDLIVTSELLVARPLRLIESAYLLYWLLSHLFIFTINDMVAGTKMPRVDWSIFAGMPVPLPNLDEQRRIAAWLDLQTARIDKRRELLAKKRELLGELRTSLIYEAVTRGVTWNVETGQASNLPLGWVMLRIKDAAKLRSGNFISAERIGPTGAYPVYGGNGLRGYTDTFTHSGTFVLVGRQGALCGNVNYAKGKFWATEHAVVVQPRRHIATRWLGEMLACMNLNQYATASAQPGLSVEVVVNKFLPFPPWEEQQTIVNYLNQKTPLIDRQITLIDQLDNLLKQQRKALIHEAVTGKIDLSQESSFQSDVCMPHRVETLPN